MNTYVSHIRIILFAFGLLFSISSYSQTIYTEDFETNFDSDTNGWTLSRIVSDMDWEGGNGGTPSGGTGPSGANSGSYYMFTESSGSNTLSKEATATSPSIDLSGYSSPSLSFYFHMYGNNIGDLSIEVNNGSGWISLLTISGQQHVNDSNPWTNQVIDLSVYTGDTIQIRFYSTSGNSGDYYRSDMGIDDVVISGTLSSSPEIDITGNAISIIGDGSNTPILSDNTDFGTAQVTSETITKTFIIENTGTGDLTLGTISLTGPSDFTIDSAPSSGTVITAGGTENIVVSFSSSTIGLQTDILNIVSDDSNEATYQINITAATDKVFYDSDGDGIYDDIDIDDDNDGITDSDEENACRLSNGASQADYKFLNETFGTGITRGTGISSLYDVYTTYCLEDGSVGSSCSGSDPGVGDGEYTVASFITDEDGTNPSRVNPTGPDIASWAWYAWAPIDDHTPGDTDGRMAVFNADVDPGVFYETQIKGTLANVPVTYSFWVINIDEPDQSFIDNELSGNASAFTHRNLPNVTVNFLSLDKSTVLATFDTGDITRCGDVYTPGDHTGTYPHAADATYNTCETSIWQQFTQQFTTSETAFVVQFVNNAPGGAGNDLAIDDIEVRQTLCDMDSDGVADVFDLDSDDDGIPDVVEANPTAANLSEGKGHLTGVISWADVSGSVSNGMHDSTEGITPVDTDGDGIPDYLDLDSDNDGIFDVDESGVINSNDTTFQNGDGDITGDGTGDGPDSEDFREKDSDGDGIIEGYGDGILDIYDFHEGNTTYSNSYGNNSQGTAPLYALDSDSDGIPDYKDPYNNLTSTYDIDTVEIYAGLPNTNGILDSTTDADGDGIMDSRDGDDTVFGSPRNLDLSYSLYFDGRNDYIEDSNVIASGSATLMAFIKSGGANTTTDNRIIAGQNDFYIRVNDTGNTVTAVSEGISLTSTSTVTDGIWMHVAVTTESGGDVVLYINGEEEARDTSSSGGITSASNFMIGRATSNSNYFNGEIDEVRVFNISLTTDELKRMVYQELDDTNSFNSGKIIPTDISATLGSNLVKYYKMDAYDDDILDDKKTATRDVSGAKMFNFKNIYFQRAPLPYETNASGNWTNTANWLYGSQWDITSKQDNPDGASIVHIKHDLTLNGSYNTQGTVGLIIDNGNELSVAADKGLYNSWYLKLDGLIDLDDESQLIQTEGSILDVTSSGRLEKDQQGTKDLYTYNYWSSPVGLSNTISNNNSFKLTDGILRNGTIPATPNSITFLTSGYNGSTSGTDISIADYWVWKYANNLSNTYSAWQHIRRTGTLLAGEGFTMKGVESSGSSFNSTQNYNFYGKPNNGDITLTIAAGNDYLVGNPYPSALDADMFILDNISVADGGNNTVNVINGALYFWEHFASGSHVLSQYEGGYGTYTLMGGAEAITTDALINTGGSLTSTKGAPQRYIPVSQGFFVSAILDTNLNGEPNDPALSQSIAGGNIIFKNSQRAFRTEAPGSSVFLKNANNKSKTSKETNVDLRQKIRLKFDSPTGYHRQLLVGVDEKASNNFDIGYDAPLIEDNKEDLFWVFNNNDFVIQAVNNFDVEQTLPLGVKISKQGLASIKIDYLENIDNNLNIYLHDKQLNIYHNLKSSNYDIYLSPDEYLERFEITFKNAKTLNTDDIQDTFFQVYFSNENNSIVIHNKDLKTIESTEILNILGQSIYKFKTNSRKNYISHKTKQLSAGTYIIKLKTDTGIVSKKVLIK